ncbi:MAG: carbon-nitrogen hydrolase family protein [Kosmotogaceae bacterium]
MSKKNICVGSVQFNALSNMPGSNLEIAMDSVDTLVNKGTKLILLPEMFNSGYSSDKNTIDVAVEMYEETIETLSALSDYNDVVIVAGMIRKVKKGFANSSAVFKPYEEPIFYDKIHLFRKEKESFIAGNKPLSFSFNGISFGIVMCYEVGFPELSRILVREGAEVLLMPFAFGKERYRIYDIATRSRALENGIFVVTSSQSGECKEMELLGQSRIVSPSGEVVESLGTGEGIMWSTLDIDVEKHYRYEEIGDSHAYFANIKDDIYTLKLNRENP